MLKKAVRLGILAMLVASFFTAPFSAQAAPAETEDWEVDVLIFDEEWNGDTSGDDYFMKTPSDMWIGNENITTSIGELRSQIEAITGYPVLILALVNDEGGCGFDTDFLIHTSDSAMIGDYPICRFGPEEDLAIFLVYKAPEVVTTRLTLYGYIKDDGQSSCTLWSLDGSKNIRPSEKCGADVELVCTVKLVDKELKYDCKDGYDWLGYNIAHDPKWVAWADKFAQRYGR